MSDEIHVAGLSRRRGPGYGSVILIALLSSVIGTLATLYCVNTLGISPFASHTSAIDERATQVTIEVPKVLHMTTDTARTELQNVELQLEVSGAVLSSDVPRGMIVEQIPAPGAQVASGAAVQVKISSGPEKVRVPAIIGQTLAEARKALEKAGLGVGNLLKDGEGEPGTITMVEPASGTEVDKRSVVHLTVAQAKEMVKVPKVIGKLLRRAQRHLNEVDLEMGRLRYTYDEDRSAGVVLHQNPEANTEVEKGSKVELLVNE